MLVYIKDRKYEPELLRHGAKSVEQVDETVIGFSFVFLVDKAREAEMEQILKTLQ